VSRPRQPSRPPRRPIPAIGSLGLVGCFTFSVLIAIVGVLIYLAIKAIA
jgi:hypothetical protein